MCVDAQKEGAEVGQLHGRWDAEDKTLKDG